MRNNIEGTVLAQNFFGEKNKWKQLSQTLAGTFTMDDDMPHLVFLNPNGVARTVLLPPEAKGLWTMIVHTGTSDFTLTVKEDSNTTTIGTLSQNEIGMFFCDGTTWWGDTATDATAILSNSPTGRIGFATGAGGAVTQLTNRTTGVTLSKPTGQITTNNASLGAELSAEFTVTNTVVEIGDVVIVSIQSGSNGGATEVIVSTVAAGSFKIKVINNNAAAGTAETGAIIINFAVIKAVAA